MKLILLLSMLFSLSVFAAPLDNCRINTQTNFGATTTSIQVLAARSSRKCLTIQNLTPNSTVYIKFNSAHTGTEGLTLPPDTVWAPVPPPINSIYIKGSNSVNTVILPVTVWEGD